MPKEKRITIRIEESLLNDFLQAIKARQDEDKSVVIRTLMRQYIKNATTVSSEAAAK